MQQRHEPSHMPAEEATARLAAFFRQHNRVVVLTGAGVSTDSGIPDYRDREGNWKTSRPVQGPDFIRYHHVRQHYWARSLIGWQRFGRAEPNAAHIALAALEETGHVIHVITQNVDGLHQRAGSREVTDLHGRLDRVICLQCQAILHRAHLQEALAVTNPDFLAYDAADAPDGDVRIEDAPFARFRLVCCKICGGILKPDVVFFGENVPAERVAMAMRTVDNADALLVAGSSLMVYSGLRFARRAVDRGLPVAALTFGKTRADKIFALKLDAPCGPVLQGVAKALTREASCAELPI